MRRLSFLSQTHSCWLYGLMLLMGLAPTLVDAQPIFYAAQNPQAFNALATGVNNIDVVHVDDSYWAWITRDNPRNVGLIWYTELWYDERAYSPIMQRVASSRYPVFLLDIPLSMPFLSPFRGDTVLRDYPEIDTWVVGGHGIGGAMASIFAQRRREEGVDGLGLFGSYPFPIFNDQSLTDIKAVSVWGNQDGKTKRVQWEDGRRYLPRTAKFIEVDGANHSQMARLQVDLVNGDNAPVNMTRDQQETIVVENILNLLEWVQSGTRQPTDNPSRSPTVSPSAAPTPSPSFRPTVSPSVIPTTVPSLAPTLSNAPSSNPTISMMPTLLTVRIIPSRFGYGLDIEAGIREATDAEVEGLLDETEDFYEDMFTTVFPGNNLLSVEITNVEEIYQPEIPRLPYVFDFDVVVSFADNDDNSPTDGDLFTLMVAYNENSYIAEYVHEAEPEDSIFRETADTEFAQRGGVV
ncbi:alpha/beta hydrolase fold [Seminavis robusta]|uniref:Alpha/beta hydrolase fold n=1 Tax=Seminavis robusta TaxID=568900 RepID=A0A9N8GZT7_9STRA|nr:alpha/beta hydrolase fold [Seminavis robusta]|eukprot:Sro9_g006990.1 alpha/beta hydrolase fold (463) ;mRNA; f:7221-8609